MSFVQKGTMRRALWGALAVLLCLIVVAALPSVQTRLARAALSRLDGVDVRLDYLAAGLGGVTVEGLRIAAPGLEASVERADVDLAFWSSLARLGLDFEQVRISGVDVRVAPVPGEEKPVSAAGPREPFAGLGPVARLPKRIRVRALEADGRLAVRPSEDVEVAGPWKLTLDSLGAGATATLRLEASTETRRDGEAVAASAVAASATADVASDGRVTRLAVDGGLRPVDRDVEVRAAAVAELGADAERYRFDLDGPKARLAQLEASFVPRVSLDGSWELNVTEGVVAAFARGRSTADVSATSTGRLHADLAQRRAEIEASVRGEGRGWDALDPRLADLGPLTLGADVDAGLDRDAVSFRKVEVGIRSEAHGELLRIAALQPLRFDLQTWLVEPEKPAEPALRLAATDVPLHWLGGLVPAARIDGGRFSGTLEVVRDAGRTTLLVAQPLKATSVTLRPVQGVRLPPFDVTLVPRATLGGGALEADVEQLRITARTGFDVQFKGRATTSRSAWPLTTFEGSLSARVPLFKKAIPELHDFAGATRLQVDFDALALLIERATFGADADDGRHLIAVELSGQEPLRVLLPHFAIDWNAFKPQSLSLRLDRMPVAWVSPYLPEIGFRRGELSADLEVAAGGGQGVRLTAAEPVTVNNLRLAYRDRVAQRTVTATVRPTLVLSNALSALRLQDLRLSGSGGDDVRGEISVEEKGDTGLVAISVALDGNVKQLAQRFGADLGKLTWRQSGELELATRRLSVGELKVAITDRDGTAFLQLDALRPFAVTPAPLHFETDGGGSAPVLHAAVTPLKLESLLPNLFGFDLEGVLPEGEFFGAVDDDGRLVLSAPSPLTFRDVSVRWGEATLLDRVSMSVDYEVAYGGDGVQARSVDLTAMTRDGRMLLHSTTEAIAPLAVDQLVNEAQIHVEGNLAPLAEQPILASLPKFSAGTLETSLAYKRVGADATFAMSTKLRDAVAEGPGRLPDLDLQLDADGVLGDHVKVALPVHLASPDFGMSDLRFEGALQRKAGGNVAFDAALTGERVAMNDVERLIDFMGSMRGAPAAEPAASSPRLAPLSEEKIAAIAKLRAVRDSMPAWSGYAGKATVALGKVEFPSFAVEGVRGKLDVTPARAALTGVSASLLGANLRAAATVGFDAAKPRPYSLDLNTAVKNLELGRVFQAAAPGVPPTADGRFDFATTLSGEGLNPLDLVLSSLGEVRLSGRDGVFRGLAASAGTGSKAARVIGFLTFSRELKAIGRLLDGLGQIRFKQADLRLERTADRIELKELSIVSPQLKIDAAGDIELAPLQPVLLSPLNVTARLAAAGDIAILFDGMKLLEGERGQPGYRNVTKPIAIAGTAAAPDTSSFWALLDEGAGNAGGSFGVGLRALNAKLEAGRKSPAPSPTPNPTP
jgi:hypothetical protein